MGSEHVRGKREVLVPDVARSSHGGALGLHMKASFTAERYYLKRTINQDPNAKVMNLSRFEFIKKFLPKFHFLKKNC